MTNSHINTLMPSIAPSQHLVIQVVRMPFDCLCSPIILNAVISMYHFHSMTIPCWCRKWRCACCFRSLHFSLYSDFSSFSPVIWCCCLLKPGVLERLFGGNSFRRIIDEDFLQQVEEIPTELIVVWYDFLSCVSLSDGSQDYLHLHLTAS